MRTTSLDSGRKPTMIFMIFEVLHLESYIKMLECNMTSKCAALLYNFFLMEVSKRIR